MCGISAIYRYTSIKAEDKQKLALMNQEMWYRGPDDNGVWSDNYCGLAHTRLSIIGLSNGQQPIFNENRSMVLICNGEIYNYIEIKEDLIKKGHEFCTDTDSEVIIHLYEEYATDCLKYLRGMFSFCLWDSNKNQLFAARDRVGEKHLYYSEIPGGVVFSSELKTILKHYINEPQISRKIINEQIRFSFPMDKKNTFIQQIKRIEQGEFIVVNCNGLKSEKYWSKPLSVSTQESEETVIQNIKDLLFESVRISLRSDVPIAVLLSGGIDSSAIAAIAKELGHEVHAITVGYKGRYDCDERSISKRFAKEKGLIWHEIELEEKDYPSYFEEYSKYVDEPVCDVAAIAQWGIYKKAKELGFKVLLSGNGGDELFFGYPYYNRIGEYLQTAQLHRGMYPLLKLSDKFRLLKFLIANRNYLLKADYYRPFSNKMFVPHFYDDYNLFINGGQLNNFDYPSIESKNLDYLNGLDFLYNIKFSTWLPANCLYLADRLGMGNSIEVRSPLIDYKLVEYVSQLPLSYRYKADSPKYLLKKVLTKLVPDYILFGQKRGFTPPKSFVDEIVKQHNYKYLKSNYKYFNSVFTDKIISQFFS